MSQFDQATDQTLSYYDGSASEYQKLVDDSETPLLAEFIDQLVAGQRVLDLGSGPGHCANAMAQADLVVDATDGSAEMVKLAGQYSGVTAKQARFDELAAKDHYDAIWANFSLLHAPRESFPDCLDRVSKALKPSGLFHIGMKVDNTDGADSLGRHYTYYGLDELKGLLEQAGMNVIHQELGSGPGMAGVEEPWVIYWARKQEINNG